MSRYYPLFADITGRLCVVVGGGAVAERKVKGLLEAGGVVRVVSPKATLALQEMAHRQQIEYRAAAYDRSQIEDAHLVFAATNVRKVNACVTEDARSLRIPVTVADAPDEGTFIVPSTVRRGELAIALSTGGAHPALAARLADEFKTRFGPEYGAFVELLASIRDTVKEWTSIPEARRAAALEVLDHETELCAHLAAGRTMAAFELAALVARQAVDAATVPGRIGQGKGDK